MTIRGSVVIVTGASSGIGRAAAKLFSAKGAKVVVVARSKQKLEVLATELPQSLVVVADMRNQADIKRMVKASIVRFGRVDVLVNNAGRGYDAPIDSIEPVKLRELFDLDIMGPLVAMQQVIPVMKKNGGGAIVNISSGTSLMAIPNMAAYSSLKRALNGISFTAREELAKDHIAVSTIYPFITATDFDKNMMVTKGTQRQWDRQGVTDLPPADPPEHVAQKIVEAVETGKAEVYAHDWMKKMSPNPV